MEEKLKINRVIPSVPKEERAHLNEGVDMKIDPDANQRIDYGLNSSIKTIDDSILNNFDIDQYKKDMGDLKKITENILKNNPCQLHKEKIPNVLDEYEYDRSIKEKISDKNIESEKSLNIRLFGDSWVGPKLSNDIIETSKKKIKDEPLPSFGVDLQELELYGVYSVTKDKYSVSFLDMMDDIYNFNVEESKKNICISTGYNTLEEKMTKNYPTLSIEVFNKSGSISNKNILLNNKKSIDINIKEFINSEFIKIIKELSNKNIEKIDEKNQIDSILGMEQILKTPFCVKIDDDIIESQKKMNLLKIKIYSISNYIFNKSRLGGATFICGSKKNMDYILDCLNGSWENKSKTYKYDKHDFKFNLISNDEFENTVVIGRLPKKNEPGVNLVINNSTIGNYVCSDEDIESVNLGFEFILVGLHPENNYFSFEMTIE